MHVKTSEGNDAEQAMQRMLERLYEAQRVARLGDWDFEIATGAISWSPCVYELFGRDPALGPPRDYEENAALFDPPSRDKITEHIQRAIESGEAQEYDVVVSKHPTGPVDLHVFAVPVRDADGVVRRLHGTVQDITDRKRTEDELRASDEKFRQFAAHVNDVFWIRSPDMKQLHFLSPGFERIWGRPIEKLLAAPLSWTEFVAPEDRQRVSATFAGLQGDVPSVDIDYRITRPDGEIRWVRARGFQVRDEHGIHIRNIGVATDITEKQLSRKALETSARELEIERSRLVAAQQVAKVGSWETDLATLNMQWSDETHRIYGLDPRTATINHSTFLERVHPADRERVNEAFTRSMRVRGTTSVEHRLLLPDGTVKTVEERWRVVFDQDDNPLRAIGTCQDITERRRAEDALRQSQKQMRDVFDGLGPSMFVGLLSVAGVLVEVNRAPLVAAGLRAEDVIGKPFEETHWWTYSKEVQLQLRDAIGRARGGESSRYDVRTRGAGNEVIDIDFSLEPLRDESGNVSFLIASASVITERKIAEDALRQAQKMEAVGQLAAGVAHEFNNLLQALMSTSAILRYQAGNPAITKAGADLEALVKRGAGLTQQLLLFARSSALEKSHVDLGEEIRTASAFLRPLMPETISIVVDVPAETFDVEADAGQIQQVLLNLAINARDAMPTGGTLTLRAGRIGNEVFQEVEDTGYGMSADTLSHLFEPFFSTKKPAKGTGLGLAVAHGIAEQHGGRFEVHSTLGEGSRFRVILPASISAAAVISVPNAVPNLTNGTDGVFVVEDDPSVRAGVSTLLELMGYDVVAAGSGEEAIALSFDSPPQLLLSDVTLPGMPGPRVAALLSERWPDLKVVLMSGYFEEAIQKNAIANGWHFLQKPFEFDDLARVLAIALLGETRDRG